MHIYLSDLNLNSVFFLYIFAARLLLAPINESGGEALSLVSHALRCHASVWTLSVLQRRFNDPDATNEQDVSVSFHCVRGNFAPIPPLLPPPLPSRRNASECGLLGSLFCLREWRRYPEAHDSHDSHDSRRRQAAKSNIICWSSSCFLFVFVLRRHNGPACVPGGDHDAVHLHQQRQPHTG